MRIQHNIMAMNAYRNYTNNVSAMKSNLEKLSSGYKINRAGDDAAGLAISEKMRAQITGLETAQKNAKDGISLVQTAEGALTEVHDMLNRMVELATQSANGTYDNETDRAQLQKELEQLNSEINRIADSSNFNGIKLLDGSMAVTQAIQGGTNAQTVDVSGAERIIQSVIGKGEKAYEVAGNKTILDGAGAKPTTAKFEIDLATMNFSIGSYQKVASMGGNLQFSFSIATTGGGVKTVTNASVSLSSLNATVNGKALATGTVLKVGDTIKVTGSIGSGVTVNGMEIVVTKGGVLKVSSMGSVSGMSAGSSIKGTVTVNAKASAMGVATKVDVKDVVKVTVAGIELSVGTAGIGSIAAGANVSSAQIAQAIASKIQNNNPVVEINNVKWLVTANGTKLNFEQIETPKNADEARANFDVKISIEKSDGSNNNNNDDFKIQLGTSNTTTTTNATGATISMSASIKPGTYVSHAGVAEADANKADTIFNIKESDLTDGTKIAIGTRTLTLAIGADSQVIKDGKLNEAQAGQSGYVKLDKDDDLNTALSKISNALGSTVNFKILDKDGKEQEVQFQIGVSDGKMGFPTGLAVQRINAYDKTATSGSTAYAFDTIDKLADNFKMRVNGTVTTDSKEGGKGLTLQIGDTADEYNKLRVSIGDMHAAALGIADLDISNQEGASDAISKIKAAINQVSDVRGTLGATQNRLDHTINNLSVMTENIQDAESTIRDTDVAEEMMAYTKNNILIQSAQAMLAQANQVPQGVLQLLG